MGLNQNINPPPSILGFLEIGEWNWKLGIILNCREKSFLPTPNAWIKLTTFIYESTSTYEAEGHQFYYLPLANLIKPIKRQYSQNIIRCHLFILFCQSCVYNHIYFLVMHLSCFETQVSVASC
jgi:hypothetical protein